MHFTTCKIKKFIFNTEKMMTYDSIILISINRSYVNIPNNIAVFNRYLYLPYFYFHLWMGEYGKI
ncbi:MAG: hypothetical protein Kow0068_14010 [Marinilabiliales bacterium]